MVDNTDEITFKALTLLGYYSRNRFRLPETYCRDLDDCTERLKRDLARVNDGSRPELILSVKMNTASLSEAMDFLLGIKND